MSKEAMIEAMEKLNMSKEEMANTLDSVGKVSREECIVGMLKEARTSIDWSSVKPIELQEAFVYFVAFGKGISNLFKIDREDKIGDLGAELMAKTIDNMGGKN